MPKEYKIGVIGSCLSNMPAVFLTSEYGCRRINNAAIGRSDQFVERYIDGIQDLPPFPEMAAILGLPEQDEKGVQRYLRENYAAHGGLTELDPNLPSLSHNLDQEVFDLILLDNLFDTNERRLVWTWNDRDLKFTFPLDIIDRDHPIHQTARYDDLLTTEQSIANWLRIIDFVREKQPTAKIVFSLTHGCTTPPDHERHPRIAEFAERFPAALGERDVQIIPQLELAGDLTKGTADWAHFDMRVYKGLAGSLYMALVSGWMPAAGVARAPATADLRPSLAAWKPAPPLREVVAGCLGVAITAVDETSRMDVTENWDSLRQVGLMTEVESAFGVQVAFEESMHANSITAIRAVLAGHGIVAPDDPNGCEPLFARFVARALATPDALYVKVRKGGEVRAFSYGEILRACTALGDRLDDVAPGSIVAIILDHGEHLYTAFIGCILKGLVPTMLPPLTRKQDPTIYREGLEVLFARVQPAVVLSAGSGLALAEGLGHAPVIDMESIGEASPDRVRTVMGGPAVPVAPDALAFLQHSSGTTGHKKGVMLTHRTVMAQARHYASSIGLQTGDGIASWLPLYHDMGLLTSFIIPTIVGCPIVSLDALEWVSRPTMLLEAIEEERAAYAWLPNFAFHHIARNDPGTRAWDFGSLKSLVSCSEPCREASFALFADRYAAQGCGREKLTTCYAMAETVFAVSQAQPGASVGAGHGPTAAYLSSGRPIAGVQIEIRSDGVVQPDDVLGEVFIRSDTLFDGYYAMPDLTAERLQDGWYCTRDLGMMSGGELFVIGRVDDLLIISGKNVVAHEIEDDLNAIDGIAAGRVFVTSAFDEAASAEELIVAAELREEADSNASEIERAVRERVFAICGIVPRRVKIVPRGFLVKSSSGKIARARSAQKLQDELPAQA